MSIVKLKRDCFVIPPRSDVIARTRNEEEARLTTVVGQAISKRHHIYGMTLLKYADYSLIGTEE